MQNFLSPVGVSKQRNIPGFLRASVGVSPLTGRLAGPHIPRLETETITATPTALLNFVGKVAGSLVENPHVARARTNAAFGTPLDVGPAQWVEFPQSGANYDYGDIAAQDGTSAFTLTTNNAAYAQHMLSFDLLTALKRAGIIPQSWDVATLKANLVSLTVTWIGYGVGANGGVATNGATWKGWRVGTSDWNALGSTAAAAPATLTAALSTNYIDSDGKTHLLAHSTYPSDGTRASTIYTDYVKVDVTVNRTFSAGTITIEESRTNRFYPSDLSSAPNSSGGGSSNAMVARPFFEQNQVRRVSRTGTDTWAFAEWTADMPPGQQAAVSCVVENDTAVGVTEITMIEVTATPQRTCTLKLTWSGRTLTAVTPHSSNGLAAPSLYGFTPLGNDRYRVWFVVGTDFDTTKTPRFRVTPDISAGSASDRAVYVGKVGIEPGTYPTTPQPSTVAAVTRAAETFQIPTAGILSPTQGAVGFWFYADAVTRRQVAGQYNRLFYLNKSGGGDGMYVVHSNSSAVWSLLTADDTGAATSVGVADTYTPDGWHQLVVAWSAAEALIVFDGVVRGTIPTPKLPSAFGSLFYLGQSGGNHLNTRFAALWTTTDLPSAAQIAAFYASGEPFPTAWNLTYRNDFRRRGSGLIVP